MNRDDINKFAKRAGFSWSPGIMSMTYTTAQLRVYLKNFAELVEQHEREQCARIVETHKPMTIPGYVSYAQEIRARGKR